MKLYLIILTICALTAFCSCHQGVNTNTTDTVKHVAKITGKSKTAKADTEGDSERSAVLILPLPYGFKIKASQGENLGDFKAYSYLELWHNGIKIFTDTAKEYEFNDKPYPIINNLQPAVFELLIEYNDRPLPDKLAFFRIENDKIVKRDVLPAFDGKPQEINGALEYSGRLDDSEVLAKDGKEYLPYNPVLYYKVTANGIKLDSALTIQKNKEKFGSFNGFHYNEKIYYPTDNKGNIDTAEKNIIRH